MESGYTVLFYMLLVDYTLSMVEWSQVILFCSIYRWWTILCLWQNKVRLYCSVLYAVGGLSTVYGSMEPGYAVGGLYTVYGRMESGYTVMLYVLLVDYMFYYIFLTIKC